MLLDSLDLLLLLKKLACLINVDLALLLLLELLLEVRCRRLRILLLLLLVLLRLLVHHKHILEQLLHFGWVKVAVLATILEQALELFK